MLELLELLNGRRLLLGISLESIRWICEAVRGTGVSGKDVADEIVMIHSTQKPSRLSSDRSGEMGSREKGEMGVKERGGCPCRAYSTRLPQGPR